MQTKEEIEQEYLVQDPWAYRTNPEDIKRKNYLVSLAKTFAPHAFRTLDIACGEAWITRDLPGVQLHGIELSDNAAERFPMEVLRVHKPDDKYDLVMATGCLYGHYDWQAIVNHINEAAKDIIIVSNIAAWECGNAIKQIRGKQIFNAFFPYREFEQCVRIFQL